MTSKRSSQQRPAKRSPPAKRPPAKRASAKPQSRSRSQPPGRRGRLRRVTRGDRPFVLGFAALLIALGAMAIGPLRNYTAAADRVDLLAETRDHLRAQVDELEDRRERLHDLEEIELLAREKHGMVKEGEVPIVVTAPEGDLTELGPSATEASEPDDAWYRRLGRVLLGLFRD